MVSCLLVGLGVLLAWPSILGGVAPWAGALTTEDRSTSQIRRGDVVVPSVFESLHQRGVTGSGVDVGVLNVTGFDASHPALSGRVAASRAFGDAAVRDGTAPRHGTAVAASLGRLVIDASLHLAVAHDAGGVAAASEWLVARDVDVVVAPFNSPGTPDDGTSRVARALPQLRAEGVVVVASAGNFGRSHWAGRLTPTGDGRHQFGANTTRNRVYPTPWTVDGPVAADIWLTWNGSRFSRDLNLRLYRLGRDAKERVATSSRVPGSDTQREYLQAILPAGQYYLVIDVPERSRPMTDAVAPRIEVTASGVTLGRTTQRESIAAPATARRVVGVGVAEPDDAVYPHSSRGPTTDGRRGVDIVAPATPFANVTALRTPGTAAATYAGATAVLVIERHPDAPAATIEQRLVRTADAKSTQPSVAAGHGHVSPSRAVLGNIGGATEVGAGVTADRRTEHRSPTAPGRGTRGALWDLTPPAHRTEKHDICLAR